MTVDRDVLRYAANYCEENTWHLAAEPALGPGERWVLLISSPSRSTPLFCQRAAKKGEPVFWDYHVVLLQQEGAQAQVYDFDSTLPFPVPFLDYAEATFVPDALLPETHHVAFRVIPAAEYRSGFDSDRSHMRRPDGSWLSPPPPWPAILGGKLRLIDALDLTNPEAGPVFSLEALLRRFGASTLGARR